MLIISWAFAALQDKKVQITTNKGVVKIYLFITKRKIKFLLTVLGTT